MDESNDAKTPRLAYLIGRIDRMIYLTLEAVLADAELSLPQYTALSVISVRPGLSNAQLARRSLVTPQAMYQALAGLDSRGLIARTPHPTRGRILCVELTSAGATLLAELDQAVDKAENELLAAITPEQRSDLLDTLTTMADLGTSPKTADSPLDGTG